MTTAPILDFGIENEPLDAAASFGSKGNVN